MNNEEKRLLKLFFLNTVLNRTHRKPRGSTSSKIMCGGLSVVRLQGSCNKDSSGERHSLKTRMLLKLANWKQVVSCFCPAAGTFKMLPSLIYSCFLFLPDQGAITLHCLQRTPDQTITLSGSQLA